MAEIKIEKRKSPVWPWVLLAVLVIAAVIWWSGDDDPDAVNANTEEVVDIGRENDTDFDNFREDSERNDVQAFVSYIETNGKKIGSITQILTRCTDTFGRRFRSCCF